MFEVSTKEAHVVADLWILVLMRSQVRSKVHVK